MKNIANEVYILNSLTFKKANTKEELIGLLTMAIYSKSIFQKNEDVSEFIQQVFDISYLNYVTRSRTLLCARLSRVLVAMDDKHFKDVNRFVSTYFSDKYLLLVDEEKLNPYKHQNSSASKDVGKWIQGLLGKSKK